MYATRVICPFCGTLTTITTKGVLRRHKVGPRGDQLDKETDGICSGSGALVEDLP